MEQGTYQRILNPRRLEPSFILFLAPSHPCLSPLTTLAPLTSLGLPFCTGRSSSY